MCPPTKTECSTLLVRSRKKEVTDLKDCLKLLYDVLFPRKLLRNRFHKAGPWCRKGPKIKGVGARLLEAFRATTGLRAVGEVLGHGKLVEARTTDSNSTSLRLTSIRHLKKPLGCSSRNAEDNTEGVHYP